jgi:sporulation protein YlmC with PRC-barrel domain
MGENTRRALTRDRIIGMQAISSDGYILGKVKELSLIIGEPDQALVIEDDQGKETTALWSEVSAAGDVILLKPKEEAKKYDSSPANCPSCGIELESGAMFCPRCGNKVRK